MYPSSCVLLFGFWPVFLELVASELILAFRTNYFQNFLRPFTNSELVELYKVAAQTAVYNKVRL